MGLFKAKTHFWIVNILGWSFFVVTNMLFQTGFFQKNFIAIGYSILIGLIGFGASLLLRHLILRFKIIDSGFLKIISASFLLMFLISSLSVALFFVMNWTVFGSEKFTIQILIGNLLNFSLIFFIWTLIYVSYLFFQNQQKLAIEKVNLILELKDAELNNLRKQLSPHFLFNSINNIRSLILIDPEKARNSLLHISDLLRYALNYQKKEKVTIEEELEIVKAYVELNTIHLGNNVDFKFDVDESMLATQIPPMSIQLMVENAIKHGDIQNRAEVKVSILKNKNSIYIEVSNPGSLKADLFSSEGIGIDNLRKRLKSLYADKSNFIMTELNGIVYAKISIND